jgi:histidine ammonia-lyase
MTLEFAPPDTTMDEFVVLDGATLTPDAVALIARRGAPVRLAPEARARNDDARRAIAAVIARGDQLYGVTTAAADPVVLDSRIHSAVHRPGQAAVAARMRELLAGLDTRARKPGPLGIQDPYTFRALPQSTAPSTTRSRRSGRRSATSSTSPARTR